MTVVAVDTSALIAILQDEPLAARCRAVLADSDQVVISAGTVAECLIVSAQRGFGRDARELIDQFGFEIVPVTADAGHAVGQAYSRWGKGLHPARLNFGDCFAYALAMERGCPLLYIGNDFAQTDVRSALAPV